MLDWALEKVNQIAVIAAVIASVIYIALALIFEPFEHVQEEAPRHMIFVFLATITMVSSLIILAVATLKWGDDWLGNAPGHLRVPVALGSSVAALATLLALISAFSEIKFR